MLQIEIEQEEDGRWIAEIPALPGVMAYGAKPEEARSKATALALRALADQLEHGEDIPNLAIFSLRPHEPLEIGSCPAGACRPAKGWLVDQPAKWLASLLERQGWPDYVLAFHDSEEIGPKMLARIARRTGLTPEDL